MTSLSIARLLRCAFGAVVLGSVAFAVFCAWRAVSDYEMQVREGWKYRCGTVQVLAVIVGSGSLGIAAVGTVAYRKAVAWQHRLNGTREV